MLSDLAALTPPAIVAVAVLIGAWAIVRRELAPKRKSREAQAAADEERAVDREHGRSLYFATSPIYLDSSPGYARRFRSLEKPGLHAIASTTTDSRHDNVRLGDLLTVHLLSRHVAWMSRGACGFAECQLSSPRSSTPPELSGPWGGYMLLR
jgi:hypothetical protein